MCDDALTIFKIFLLTRTKNFAKYVQYMESQGAHKAGVAKIIPPKGTIKVQWTGLVHRT